MHKLLWSDQSVIADQRFARCLDPFLAVCCKRQVGGAGVPPVKGPFCLAVTDNEATGCHVSPCICNICVRCLIVLTLATEQKVSGKFKIALRVRGALFSLVGNCVI